ncbi:MAG: hypothetical protein AAF092_15710 [Pseudomonadota bacterium]
MSKPIETILSMLPRSVSRPLAVMAIYSAMIVSTVMLFSLQDASIPYIDQRDAVDWRTR